MPFYPFLQFIDTIQMDMDLDDWSEENERFIDPIFALDTSITVALEDKLADVPFQVPLKYSYPYPKYYVRDCYPQYLDVIERVERDRIQPSRECLRGTHSWITVTGTPGVGMSMFYLYVFNHFRRNTNRVVVTASFSEQGTLQKCVLFKPGEDGFETTFTDITLGDHLNPIFLYNGIPGHTPYGCQMVVFCSPDRKWTKPRAKDWFRSGVVHLPVWSLKELKQANGLLKLGLSEQTVEERFSVFDGVARWVLCSDKRAYQSQVRELEVILSSFYCYQPLQQCILREEHPFHHRIFYLCPLLYIGWEKVRVGSNWMLDRILAAIKVRDFKKRMSLMHSLRTNYRMAPLLLPLFRSHCHFLFGYMGEFVFTSLTGSRDKIVLRVSECTETSKLDLVGPSCSSEIRDRYTLVESFGVDSLYFDTERNILYLFLMTVSSTCTVEADNLARLLDYLGLKLVKVKLNLKLVYFLPERQSRSLSLQTITPCSVSCSNDLSNELVHTPQYFCPVSYGHPRFEGYPRNKRRYP